MDTSSGPAKLPEHYQRWLDAEQKLNEPIDRDPDGRVRILLDHHNVKPAWRPENRGEWPQEVVWLPRNRARQYGSVVDAIADAFDLDVPQGRIPLFVHPQPPVGQRRLIERYRSQRTGVWATPTSSCRTVLAWSDRVQPAFLKLSLGAVVSGGRRSLGESDIVSALVISRLLDLIPKGTRKDIGFDWFSEPAGAVDGASGTGWLLRTFPMRVSKGGNWWIPAFSLISRSPKAPPILVEMIAASGSTPERFVLERVLRPYVAALGWLLFEEGIQVEGHTQNILFEMSKEGELTGRIALRDLSDMSVSIEHRIARQRRFPDLSDLAAQKPPFSVVTVAADFQCKRPLLGLGRASVTVERFGLRGFVWAINTSLARYFARYRRTFVERQYLSLWQDELIRRLGVKARHRRKGLGLAVDEAISEFWRRVDWVGLGARVVKDLPELNRKGASAKGPLMRIECAWGELFIERGIPSWFREAF